MVEPGVERLGGAAAGVFRIDFLDGSFAIGTAETLRELMEEREEKALAELMDACAAYVSDKSEGGSPLEHWRGIVAHALSYTGLDLLHRKLAALAEGGA